MISRPFLIHLLFMLLGYALAVLTATTVVCVILGLPTVLPDQGRWGSFYRYLQDLPPMLCVGAIMTAMYGFPGWLISVTTAEIRSERRKIWFAVAGTLTGLLAQRISRGRSFIDSSDAFFTVAILIGGFCGGLAYWLVAGKRSGIWRKATPTEVPA
jgi:energy-converting hydrogenase Eha subunit A